LGVTAYLGLGSNLGNRKAYMDTAREHLQELPRTEILKVSSLYETSPVGKRDQAWFLNAVIKLRTFLPAETLLDLLLALEERMGRVREERWGPRVIDLDLLLYGDLKISTSRLTLPHPRLTERLFVLIPLAEIEPELILPDGRSIKEAIRGPFPHQEVRFYSPWR